MDLEINLEIGMGITKLVFGSIKSGNNQVKSVNFSRRRLLKQKNLIAMNALILFLCYFPW